MKENSAPPMGFEPRTSCIPGKHTTTVYSQYKTVCTRLEGCQTTPNYAKVSCEPLTEKEIHDTAREMCGGVHSKCEHYIMTFYSHIYVKVACLCCEMHLFKRLQLLNVIINHSCVYILSP